MISEKKSLMIHTVYFFIDDERKKSYWILAVWFRISTYSLAEWIPSPQIGKPLFAFNDWHGSMLTQVVKIAIGILHVKDHCLALFRNCLDGIVSLGISPSWKCCLTSLHSFVQVETKVDGSRWSVWSSIGVTMVGMGSVFGFFVVMNDLQVFVNGDSAWQIRMFTRLTMTKQCLVNLENVSSTLDDGIHDWTVVSWKPCRLGGSNIADLHIFSTSSGGPT
mmetsp:Transcript_9432/g.22262  ORF Transcript_9432/g.22262 Transcript_9432/m.22262 type:complete len:220 (+) Transcript_9432:1223-1882(+)